MTKSAQELAAAKIAQDMAALGYAIVLQPTQDKIPFDLQGYCPDILASKNNEHVLIEVKTTEARRNLERYMELTDLISRHKGWRFMISTVPPESLQEPGEVNAIPTRQEIAQLLAKLEVLLASESAEFAIPYLWTVLMAGLRIAALEQNIPVDNVSDLHVLNYAYSMGVISHSDLATMKSYLELRNRVTHNLAVSIDKTEIERFYGFTKARLREWAILTPVPA